MMLKGLARSADSDDDDGNTCTGSGSGSGGGGGGGSGSGRGRGFCPVLPGAHELHRGQQRAPQMAERETCRFT